MSFIQKQNLKSSVENFLTLVNIKQFRNSYQIVKISNGTKGNWIMYLSIVL